MKLMKIRFLEQDLSKMICTASQMSVRFSVF